MQFSNATLVRVLTLASSPTPVGLSGQSKPDFESIAIGAFDPEAWNGLVLLARAHQQFVNSALRVGSWSGMFLDGNDISNAVSEVGPSRPGRFLLAHVMEKPSARS